MRKMIISPFGDFLRAKRLARKMTVRKLSEAIGVSMPYYCDIECGRRNPPTLDKLNLICETLELSDEERIELFELAGKDRDEISPDLPDYIKERQYVRTALRAARDLNADEDDWQHFVEDLRKRKG